MKEKIQNIGQVLLSVGVLVGLFLLIFFFIEGGVRVSDFLFPWLSLISGYTFFACILILLPLTIFRKVRAFSGFGFFVASYIFGVTLWTCGFLYSYVLWGATAIIIGLFLAGVGVVPIAMLATAFKGDWSTFGYLVFQLFLTIGLRAFGLYLVNKSEINTDNDNSTFSPVKDFDESIIAPSQFIAKGNKAIAPNGEEVEIVKRTDTHATVKYSDGETEKLPIEDLKPVNL
jgi:hypothetical protein